MVNPAPENPTLPYGKSGKLGLFSIAALHKAHSHAIATGM
jgi:hypothetical protein